MRKLSAIVLFMYVISISGFAQSLSYVGKKTESDTITNSLRASVEKVTSLKGVDKDKTLAILIVEDSGRENLGFGGRVDVGLKSFLVDVPVIGWFLSVQTTQWSAARLAQPTQAGEFGNMYSRSSIAESFIISELVNKGYNVVEASMPFYRNMDDLDDENVRNYGRELGADTVIIGSVGGSVLKVIQDENHFALNQYFIADLKMNLRSVDTETRKVLDSDTYSGVDSVNTMSNIKWFNIILSVAAVITGISALAGAFDSEEDDYDDDYDDDY